MLHLHVHCLPCLKQTSFKDLAKHAEINLASVRILDTLDARVQISYLRRCNRVNSIKRKERLCTLECQFRAAAIGIVLQIPRSLDYGNEASLWPQDARFDNKQIIRSSCILQFSSLEFANPKNH